LNLKFLNYRSAKLQDAAPAARRQRVNFVGFKFFLSKNSEKVETDCCLLRSKQKILLLQPVSGRIRTGSLKTIDA